MQQIPDWMWDPTEFIKRSNELAITWTTQIMQAKMTLAANAFDAWYGIWFRR